MEDELPFLVTEGFLKNVVDGLCCRAVLSKGSTFLCQELVRVECVRNNGVAVRVLLKCKNVAHNRELWTSNRTGENSGHHANNVAVVAALLLEKVKYVGVRSISAALTGQRISQPTYNAISGEIYAHMVMIGEESIVRAREALIDLITAAYDGTFSKRWGFNSLYGVVTCLDALTKKLIGICVLSRYCPICFCHRKKPIVDPPQHVCLANHKGSAPAMEPVGCVQVSKDLFDHGKKVEEFLADGDSKGFVASRDAMEPLYGFKIKKLEDKNHFAKRLKHHILKELKRPSSKRYHGKVASHFIKASFITKLCKIVTSNLNNYLSPNSSEQQVREMILAPYYHYLSTDKKPDHRYCPSGATSFCTWKKAKLAGGQAFSLYRHTEYIPCMEVIKPAFDHLCQVFTTQNPGSLSHAFTTSLNEAYHSLLWGIQSKSRMCSFQSLQFSAYYATAVWNDGMETTVTSLYERLGIPLPEARLEVAKKYDAARAYQYQARLIQKAETQARAMEKAAVAREQTLADQLAGLSPPEKRGRPPKSVTDLTVCGLPVATRSSERVRIKDYEKGNGPT